MNNYANNFFSNKFKIHLLPIAFLFSSQLWKVPCVTGISYQQSVFAYPNLLPLRMTIKIITQVVTMAAGKMMAITNE